MAQRLGDDATVTFVLTGPREGQSVLLGGRYAFVNGKLSCPYKHKEKVAMILCTTYCCNVEGDAPIWETVDGASVLVGQKPVTEKPTTTVVGEVEAKVVAPESNVESKSGDKSKLSGDKK